MHLVQRAPAPAGEDVLLLRDPDGEGEEAAAEKRCDDEAPQAHPLPRAAGSGALRVAAAAARPGIFFRIAPHAAPGVEDYRVV